MIDKITDIALEAGKVIMEIYNSADFGVEMKDDNSPLTLADKASHKIITEKLANNFPGIPILSEEGKDIPYATRKDWKKFWLVDPLDGTKEFIKKNGEFTVNIALIENGVPTLGVIYAPAYLSEKLVPTPVGSNLKSEKVENNLDLNLNDYFEGTLYLGEKGKGAYKVFWEGISGLNSDENSLILSKISVAPSSPETIAVKSRSHSSEEEEKILKDFGVTDSISVGSSLKFCMVAEGRAQVYYRHGPTNEWDVGAGHAIVTSAGGTVEGIRYNKENVLNSSFLVKA